MHSGRLWSFIRLPRPTFGGLWEPLGSICRLRESIGAPLGIIGGHFGGHFAIIFYKKKTKMDFVDFYNLGFSFQEKCAMKRHKCERTTIFVSPNRGQQKNRFPPQTRHRVGMHVCRSKCTSPKLVYQTFVTKPQFLQYQMSRKKQS